MASVADLIVRRLRDSGVGFLFGVPGGGSSLDLIDSAGRAGLPFVLTATETAGALAAVAQTEISGRPGACLTTLGPGVASVVNGVACARLDRAPLLVFTDSHPSSGGGTFEHQRLDHRALLAPVTKWSATLTAENADDILRAAVDCAMGEPRGPVHIECPADVLSATRAARALSPADLARGLSPAHGARASSPRLDGNPRSFRGGQASDPPEDGSGEWPQDGSGDGLAPPDGSSLAPLLSRARKPLLLVGLGARRPRDAAAIRALCASHRLPAMVTYKAKGAVPDHDPHFAGVFTNGAIEQPIVAQADLLIGVGLDPVELIPRPWTHAQPIINCGGAAADDRHVPFAAQLVGAVPTAMDQIARRLQPAAWDLDAIRRTVVAQRSSLCPAGGRLAAHHVVQVAANAAAARARVTIDAGAHMFPATMLWPVGEPNRMLISNGLSTMGFALPAAIGAALMDQGGPVIALTGDGGLLMCAAELLTAVRERLRVIVIVFSDASLSLIDIKQRQRRLASSGVSLGDVAWGALAVAFGAVAHLASTEAELERALAEALDHRGPSLIEARIDPTPYGETLHAIRG